MKKDTGKATQHDLKTEMGDAAEGNIDKSKEIHVIPTLNTKIPARRILKPDDSASEIGDKHLIYGEKSSQGDANSSYAPNFGARNPRRGIIGESNASGETNRLLNK